MFPLNGNSPWFSSKRLWVGLCWQTYRIFQENMEDSVFMWNIPVFKVGLNATKTVQRPNRLCFQSSSGSGPLDHKLFCQWGRNKNKVKSRTDLLMLWARPRTKAQRFRSCLISAFWYIHQLLGHSVSLSTGGCWSQVAVFPLRRLTCALLPVTKKVEGWQQASCQGSVFHSS